MELAIITDVISDASCSSDVDTVVRRLQGEAWAQVCTGVESTSMAARMASSLGISPTVVEEVDFEQLIETHPGQQVVVVCAAHAVRRLVAEVLDVDVAVVPDSQALSLTRVRAGRTGTRSLICFNDTLHLPMSPRRVASAIDEADGVAPTRDRNVVA
jgi:hypothetical protein